MENKQIQNTSDTKLSDLDEFLKVAYTGDDPVVIRKNLKQKMLELIKKEPNHDTNEEMAQTLSIVEFDKGVLLSLTVPDTYRTFSIQFMRDLQKEYKCITESEKSLSESVVVNFVRTLYIQRKITDYLRIGSVTEIGVKYLSVLSKELDRANRHYLTALQALKAIKQPNFEVNVKTQTAVIGQNQVIQSNNK